MGMLSDLMKESEKLKFRLLQKKMTEVLTYLTALYFNYEQIGYCIVQNGESSARQKGDEI